MKNLLRFDFNDRDGVVGVVENGHWVRATDYDALAAKLAEVEAQVASDDGLIDRCEDVITRQQKRIEELEARAEAAEAALPAVYRLAWEDAYQEHPFDAGAIPTAAELMARIKESDNG